MIILPFLPCTNLFFYVGFVAAERCLYLPSMGFCLLVAIGFHDLFRQTRRLDRNECFAPPKFQRTLITIAFITTIVVFAARAHLRTWDWTDEEALYRSGVHINPPKAYGNLANVLSAQGRKHEAEKAYRLALQYRSNMADVHYNL